jgi:hypothetical protein
MATLEQLRSLFPDAGSDSDVIKSAAKEFGISPTQIATEIGYDINKPGFMSDVKRGTGQVIGAFGSTAQDLGLPRVGKAVEGYGEDIQFRNPSQINTVGEAIRSPLTTVREALGEVVPQIGASTAFGVGGRVVGGAIGSLAGPGGTLLGQSIGAAGGAYVGNLIQEYGGIRSEQREQGIEDKKRALGTGAAAAALDTAFGTERVVNKFLSKGSDILAREAGTSLYKHAGKQAAIGLGTEALTETGQTALERYGAHKELTGDEALNEYGLSAIKGGIGGGIIRGGMAAISGERPAEGGNEIQQAFKQPEVSSTPINNAAPPIAPLVATPANHPDPGARIAELEAIGKGTPARTVEGPDGQPLKIPATEGRFFTPEEQQEYKALKAQVATMTPPVVAGGTTDIAQQTQAAAAENQQVEIAQQQLAKREEVLGKVATEYTPDTVSIFGQTITGPRIAPFGNRFADVFNTLQPHVQKIAEAIVQANKAFATPEKPSPLVSFSFNATNPRGSAEKAIAALGKVMTKFQIDHVQSLDEAVQILNKLSTTTKGNQLEQLNAIYEAITGQDTDGFTAAQATKAEKEAKNGKLSQQTTTGLGNVPVEGGTRETNAGNDGNVQPSGVQPLGTGSLPEGSLGLQTGQLSGEGIRTGTSTDAGVVSGNAPQNAQVIGAPNEQAVQSTVGGGETSGQSQQAGAPNVDQQPVQAGPRTYDPRISFYSTDLSHISSERRVQLISDLLLRVLAPIQNRTNTVPAEKRAEILRLALLEQFRHADIAEYTGLKVNAVQKQLERMGVKLVDGEFQVVDPAFATRFVEAAAAYRSPEFPDGIGQGELTGLYNTRYEGEEQSAASLAEELEAGEQEGKPGAKLQEELGSKENAEGQTMGTVSTAGGSQGAVDSEAAAFFDKVEKLQTALEALPPKDPRRAAKAEEIQKLWADYAKSQETRRAKGEAAVTEEGDENAVQVESTDEGNVREPAGGGKKVGKGNAKPKKSAGKAEVKVEPKQEAKPEEIKTPAEEWADLSKLAPEIPPYDVLTNSEKSRWDDLVRRGQANLAAAVKIIGESTQPVSTVLANEKPAATSTDGTTEAVNSKSAKFMTFDELEDEVKGITDVREQFADMDMEHALDFVSDWQVVNIRGKDAFHGQLKTENGRYIGVLNSAKMSSPAYAAETARHEIAHAVDMAPHGGVYSHQLEMNVEIKDGKVVPFGEVAEEMFALYETNPAFTTFLDYPFNINVHTDLDTNGKIESELFAQIFSIYTNPKYTDYIASVAPKTATFLEEVINDIRTTTALQIQKSTTAATRAIDFRNRYTARRDQRAAAIYGGNRQATEQPFNKRGQGREFTVDQVIKALPKPLQASARNQWTNIKTLAKRGFYASAITEDLANMAKKYMPSVSKYLQAQYARQATRLNFEKRIENILASYDKLPEYLKGENKGSVNEFIHDSTREKKWGYYPGEHQVGTKLFEVDEDFKKRFDAFPAPAQQLIKDVFQHGYDALRLKQQAAENAVNREFDSRIKAAGNDADLLQQIAKEKKQAIKRITNIRNVSVGDPYAYLGRYGDYVVVAKSKEFIAYEEAATGTEGRVGAEYVTGDKQQAKNWLQENVSNPLHYVVQFAETQGEADEIAAKLKATGQYDVQPEDAGIKEANASYFGGSDVHLAVARLRNLAERRSDSPDSKLDKAIADLYLMSVADASARASELQRKNVAGADKNMMRNLATSGRADAHFLASLEHSDEISDSLEAMRTEARRNRKEAMPMYNELYIRHANSMDYQPVGDLATALTRMTTLWTLSTNPAFYLQQVLQTSVLSLPFMAGRLGYFRSARAIKRAYGDMSELVKGLGVNEHIDFNKAPADVRNMLNTLVGMGKIDLGIDAEAKARTDEQGVLGKVMLKLQGVNTRIESINRATAAIAAYRGYLERYKNGDTAAATKYAADVVSNTHGSYDGFNTPRVLQGGVSKVALQFKRFQIIQLSMLAKLIHTSFKGASAEEKAVARASLRFITAHMAVLGGALGVPFVSQAAWILSKVFGDEDEPDDYEYKLRRMIGDGPTADLLLRGVPAALGLESLGKKLSMENVASPFGPFVEPDLTSRSGAEKMLVGIMGPAVNIGLKFTDALGLMSKGDYYKGLEMALPNGVANVMKGIRFANEGITMRNGDLVMKPEEISMIDAAFQAVGLPTSTITDRQFTQKVVAEYDKFYAEQAKDIKGSYVEASRNSDSASMAEAREDWQKLQESRVRNGYKRQPMSELFRAPIEARKRERSVVGGVETTKAKRKFVEQVSSVS